jgi:hypothetical protein
MSAHRLPYGSGTGHPRSILLICLVVLICFIAFTATLADDHTRELKQNEQVDDDLVIYLNNDYSRSIDNNRFHSHNETETTISSEELLLSDDEVDQSHQMTVVHTVDGYIHALDGASRPLWKLDTGGPLTASHHCIEDRSYSLIPETSGAILVHNKENIRRSTITTKMLVERTPFISEKDGLFFVGQKTSRIFGIDVATGEVVIDTGAVKGASAKFTVTDSTELTEDVGNFSGSSLWIGRIDYILRAFDSESGIESFNLTYGEIIPLSLKQSTLGYSSPLLDSKILRRMNTALTSPRQPSEPHSRSGGSVKLPMLSSEDGDLFRTNFNRNTYSRIPLGSPAVSAFTFELRAGLTSAFMNQDPLQQLGGSDFLEPDWDSVISTTKPILVPRRLLPYLALPSPADLRSNETVNISDFADNELAVHSVILKSHPDGGLYAVEIKDLSSQASTHSALANAINLQLPNMQGQAVELDPPAASADLADDGVTSVGKPKKKKSLNRLKRLLMSSKTRLVNSDKIHKIKYGRRRNGKLKFNENGASAFIGPVRPPPSILDLNEIYDEDIDEASDLQSTDLLSTIPSASHLCASSDEESDALQLPLCGILEQAKWMTRLRLDHEQALVAVDSAGSQQQRGAVDDDRQMSSTSYRSDYDLWNNIIYPSFLSEVTDVTNTDALLTPPQNNTAVLSLHGESTAVGIGSTLVNMSAFGLLAVIASCILLSAIIAAVVTVVVKVINRLTASNSPTSSTKAESLQDGGGFQLITPATPITPVETPMQITLSDEVLGYGSHGTIVFKGWLNGRAVAIKRMLSHFHKSAERW